MALHGRPWTKPVALTPQAKRPAGSLHHKWSVPLDAKLAEVVFEVQNVHAGPAVNTEFTEERVRLGFEFACLNEIQVFIEDGMESLKIAAASKGGVVFIRWRFHVLWNGDDPVQDKEFENAPR